MDMAIQQVTEVDVEKVIAERGAEICATIKDIVHALGPGATTDAISGAVLEHIIHRVARLELATGLE